MAEHCAEPGCKQHTQPDHRNGADPFFSPVNFGGKGGGQQRQTPAQRRQAQITEARRNAFHRVNVAYLNLNGTHPSLGAQRRREGLLLARQIISPRIQDIGQVLPVIESMMMILRGADIIEGPEIAGCNLWAAYVVGNRAPIHLCRKFFTETPEQKIRTLIHESAHAAGIGQSGGESYIMSFDCSPSSGDSWDVADAWGHFIHCVTNQTHDVPQVISPRATPAPGRR